MLHTMGSVSWIMCQICHTLQIIQHVSLYIACCICIYNMLWQHCLYIYWVVCIHISVPDVICSIYHWVPQRLKDIGSMIAWSIGKWLAVIPYPRRKSWNLSPTRQQNPVTAESVSVHHPVHTDNWYTKGLIMIISSIAIRLYDGRGIIYFTNR